MNRIHQITKRSKALVAYPKFGINYRGFGGCGFARAPCSGFGHYMIAKRVIHRLFIYGFRGTTDICMDIESTLEKFIERARVARLATADSESKPHLVPVVFVFDGNHFLIPIDEKRKTVKPEKLKRVLNINENPNVALLIDQYSEDWTKLEFVMVQGKASVVNRLQEETAWLQEAYKKLMIKYPQYQKIGLGKMCIMIKPEKLASWQNTKS